MAIFEGETPYTNSTRFELIEQGTGGVKIIVYIAGKAGVGLEIEAEILRFYGPSPAVARGGDLFVSSVRTTTGFGLEIFSPKAVLPATTGSSGPFQLRPKILELPLWFTQDKGKDTARSNNHFDVTYLSILATQPEASLVGYDENLRRWRFNDPKVKVNVGLFNQIILQRQHDEIFYRDGLPPRKYILQRNI
ncbi:hypothetical protein H6802_02175 [Candidatus Nomurabacteria bacterium]|uniref:Uncharacterized protein n=1 Tax=candidate division WWE3 bacterium TaxID=2053526 RepID=A0A955E1J0_UNCKA|nr:hypothetical protein [candidate division WWE3 bacterium]MCB9823739.1 hypothetical protein [Candidatus Nomurabacteria bacterium]MCB9827182.1 hypothetical protein [Candidatus Nomurabacteria bacterium]MCB9827534.1 hypothetical protein [Candidatus Nomurabacteria bacterium]HXK52797.1 hypothetical protein [bacterium]